MVVDEQRQGDVAVLSVQGRLDSNTSNALDEKLAETVGANSATVLDLSQLDYISSAGLRVLLKAAKQAKAAKTKLSLAALHPQVLDVFEMSGFSSIFAIYEDRQAAVAAMA